MHRWRRSNGYVFGANRLKVLSSNLKKDSKFKKNFEYMKDLVSELNKKKRLVKIGGSLDTRKKHIKPLRLSLMQKIQYYIKMMF